MDEVDDACTVDVTEGPGFPSSSFLSLDLALLRHRPFSYISVYRRNAGSSPDIDSPFESDIDKERVMTRCRRGIDVNRISAST